MDGGFPSDAMQPFNYRKVYWIHSQGSKALDIGFQLAAFACHVVLREHLICWVCFIVLRRILGRLFSWELQIHG